MKPDKDRITYSLANISEAAEFLIKNSAEKTIWLFDAPMGAGKTTLIAELCNKLHVKGDIQSPTYNIINEYVGDKKVVHMDLYRLKSVKEALDIGIDDYLYSGMYCFIEWPGIISEILPDNCMHVFISILDENNRELRLGNERN